MLGVLNKSKSSKSSLFNLSRRHGGTECFVHMFVAIFYKKEGTVFAKNILQKEFSPCLRASERDSFRKALA